MELEFRVGIRLWCTWAGVCLGWSKDTSMLKRVQSFLVHTLSHDLDGTVYVGSKLL